MSLGGLAAKCMLLVLVPLLHETSPFLLPHGPNFGFSRRLFPWRPTGLAALQFKVNPPSPRAVIPLTFSQSGVPSLRAAAAPPSVQARSVAVPSQQPFSPWRGKRGPAIFFAQPRSIDKGYFSPWRGKRIASVMPSENALVNDGHVPLWRRKRSSFGMPPEKQTGGETNGDVTFASAGAKWLGFRILETHPASVTSTSKDSEHQQLPSQIRKILEKSLHLKHRLQKRISRIQSPNAVFGNEDHSQSLFTDVGLKSSLLSDHSPTTSHREQLKKPTRASPASDHDNTMWDDSKISQLNFDENEVWRYGQRKTTSGQNSGTVKVDDVTMMPRFHNGELTMEFKEEEKEPDVHDGKNTEDLENRHMTPNSGETGRPDDIEPLTEKESDDWIRNMKGNLLSGSPWYHLLQKDGFDLDQHTTSKTHLPEYPDLPTRVYDHSQPGVGPFFWVDEDPDSDTTSNKTETAESTRSPFLLNDGFEIKEEALVKSSDKNLFGHSTSVEDKGGLLNNYQHAHSFSVANAPPLVEAESLKYGSRSKPSENKDDSKLMKNEHHHEGSSSEILPSEQASPQKYKEGIVRSTKHWNPVFRNQFPALRKPHLPLSVASRLHAANRIETPSSEHVHVPHLPPLQSLRDLTPLQSLQNLSPLRPLYGLSPLEPARVSTSNPEKTSSRNVSPEAVRNRALSRQHIRGMRGSKALKRPLNHLSLNDKAINVHHNLEAPSRKATRGDETPDGSISKTLKGILRSIHDLSVGSRPPSDPQSSITDLALPVEGAGLVGSHADVVEDTPDRKRVIKYQELAVLSTKGGITLTADDKGHFTIMVDSFQDGDTDIKNTTLPNKENDQNHTSTLHQQSPVLFRSLNISVNMTQRGPDLDEAYTDNNTLEQNNSEFDVSKDPRFGRFDKTDHVIVSSALTTPDKDNRENQSKSDIDTTPSTDFNRIDQSNSFFHTPADHNANGSNKREDTAVLSKPNKHDTKLVIPKNRILSSNRALRAFTLFQQFPFPAPLSTNFAGRPVEKTFGDGKTPIGNQGEQSLSRNRREVDSHKLSNAPQRDMQMANGQSHLVEHSLPQQSLSVKEKERRNGHLQFAHGQKQTIMDKNQSNQRLHSKMGRYKRNMRRKPEHLKYLVSFHPPQQDTARGKRRHLNEDHGNHPDTQRTQSMAQKTKRFLTRANEETAVKQTAQFYSNYFPVSHLHRTGNKNHPRRHPKNHRGYTRYHSSPKSQWGWSTANRHSMSEPYIIYSGRTFKPKWYFRNAMSAKPSRDGKPGNPSHDQQPTHETSPHGGHETDSQSADPSVAEDTVNTWNESSMTNRTSAQRPLFPHSWTKDDKAATVYTDRLLRNLRHLFRISFDIQFQPLSPNREPPQNGQSKSDAAPLMRLRRNIGSWSHPRYESYFLFPLGNIGWVTFHYPHLPAKYRAVLSMF